MDLNKIFEGIPEAMVVLSPDYKIIAATDKYLRIVMREREQIIGLHFLLEAFPNRVLSYEDNPVRISLDKARETKKVDILDVIRYDLPKPTGEYDMRYWEASHTPILNDAGEVLYIIQHTSDVTEREKAKEAFSTIEGKFSFMAEAMPQLIFTTDADGQVNYFNNKWVEYTGKPMEDLLQDSWQEIVHPDDLPNAVAKWEEALQTGGEMQVELRIREKHGKYRWHLSRSLPMKDAKGNTKMWVGSSTDINDTRNLVQELLESNEQMALLSDQVQQAYEKAESERKTLETLITKAPAMFVILKGPDHRFELLSEKYQQLYPGRDLVGLPLGDALPEIREQGFIKLLDHVYNTGETFVAEEVPIMLPKDGVGPLQAKYFNFSYQPIFESDKIVGILAFGYDISNEVLYKKQMQELG